MATVIGVTKAKMQQIQNSTITSARVENGVLYFKKGDGVTEFDVGRIVLPAIAAWPVGSIFMTVQNKNPKELLGVPSSDPVTWARWGQGRMPISQDPTVGSRFIGIESEGGSEAVALGVTQIPAHDHGGSTGYQSHDHTHTGYAAPAGQHNHTQWVPTHRGGIQGGGGLSVADNANGNTATTWDAGYHDHTVSTNGVSTNHYHAITPQGGGLSHENMPPYITVYMWKRTI